MQTLEFTTTISEAPPSDSRKAWEWEDLLQRSQTRTVFQTSEWQQSWWQAYGRGTRMFAAIEKGGQPHALAPLFTVEGMVYFIGSGGSDYLDFLGDTTDPEVLTSLLRTVRAAIPNFVGCHFFHVPDESGSGRRLKTAAERLGWECYHDGLQPAPTLRLLDEPEAAQAAPRKKSLLRHERYFRREGMLNVTHYHSGNLIRPQLEEFFEQHRNRWASTPSPSLFCESSHREFYNRLAEQPNVDWLRFTRVEWDGRPIAFHFGFFYRGVFMWYKPSFAIELSRHSPGEVLLRNLLLFAHAHGAEAFDFGLGDEPFKQRFATTTRTVRNWGIYPR